MAVQALRQLQFPAVERPPRLAEQLAYSLGWHWLRRRDCQSGVWRSASGAALGEKVIGGYVSYHDASNSGAAYCPEGAVLIGLINDKSLDSYHMACQTLR